MFAIGDNDPTEAAVKALFLPGPPAITAVSPCKGGAVVSWSAPSSAGDVPLEGYTVTASDGTTVTTDPQTTTAVITGLDNSREYTFTVNARSAEGPGADSEPSAAIDTTNGKDKCPAPAK
jgi:titin